MKHNKKQNFFHTILWGFLLWLFGYVLGFVFYAFVPKNLLGWYIMPFGVIVTLWVLFKKIKRDSLACFFMVGLIWMIMAVVLDYVFLVKLLNATTYYKLDVYLYYSLTFLLPIIVGWYKLKKHKSS